MNDTFVLAQLDPHLVLAGVQAERHPHDPVELQLARADAGRRIRWPKPNNADSISENSPTGLMVKLRVAIPP